MPPKRLSVRWKSVLAALALNLLAAGSLAFAQKESVLYSFSKNGNDGTFPYAGLTFDSSGSLFGSTYKGGSRNLGTVFELTPQGQNWAEKILHSFNGRDGSEPTAGLILDRFGNLYGATQQNSFELIHQAGGRWTESVLADAGSVSNLALNDGKLYGETLYGGRGNAGTIFELSRGSDGKWTAVVLYAFTAGSDGANPRGGLSIDAHGNLYGTTYAGGASNAGTVFELARHQAAWEEKLLYSFTNSNGDGLYPYGGVIFDNSGNLYGTTFYGGAHNYGSVFELKKSRNTWNKTIVYSFAGPGKGDGAYVGANVAFNKNGNLYGVTQGGGVDNRGTVFELKKSGSTWTERVIHSFVINGKDGISPTAALVFDAAGNLYGTTPLGGAHSAGTVFTIRLPTE